jgi:hypothetical protein
MGALAFLTIGGFSTLFLIVLYAIEDKRGSRFGERVRTIFDRLLADTAAHIRTSIPDLNDHFFREVFHFLVHSVLSFILATVRRTERAVLKIVRFNRMQVMHLRSQPRPDAAPGGGERAGHLAEVMDHKRSVELTPKEKAKRKEDAIEG